MKLMQEKDWGIILKIFINCKHATIGELPASVK